MAGFHPITKIAIGVGVTIFALATALAIYGAVTPAQSESCAAEKVSFRNLKIDMPYGAGTAHLTGKMRHTCPAAVGIELGWTVYYQDGSIAFVAKLWPASDANIPPNVDYNISLYHDVAGTPAKFSVEASDVQHW